MNVVTYKLEEVSSLFHHNLPPFWFLIELFCRDTKHLLEILFHQIFL